MRIDKLQPSTLISLTRTEKNRRFFVGSTEEVADTSSKDSTGYANRVQGYFTRLKWLGLASMAYADVTVYFMRASGNEDASDAFLKKVGAPAKFIAALFNPLYVGIAWLEFGAAGDKGRVSILMPVWCSELNCWIRVRYIISRDLVDTHVQPSDELCKDALAAAEKMAWGSGGLGRLYKETGLVYIQRLGLKGASETNNGKHAIIHGEYKGSSDAEKGKKLRAQLRKGLKGGRKMTVAVEKVLGEAAAASGSVSIEDIHEAAKAAGSPGVKPNATFDSTFRAAFDQFLGAVGKKLNKVGCMGSIKTKKGKRAAEESGASLGTGGKAGAKKPGARKKARKRPPKGKTANPLDMMQ